MDAVVTGREDICLGFIAPHVLLKRLKVDSSVDDRWKYWLNGTQVLDPTTGLVLGCSDVVDVVLFGPLRKL